MVIVSSIMKVVAIIPPDSRGYCFTVPANANSTLSVIILEGLLKVPMALVLFIIFTNSLAHGLNFRI